jgi:autotransporter-associated beta strand protein
LIAGSIDQNGGSLGITKTGSGTLVLSGANTYSGGTTVLAGVLQLANPDALQAGSGLTVGAGASLLLGSDQTAAGPGTSTLATATAQLSAPAVTASQMSGASTAVVASPAVVVSAANMVPAAGLDQRSTCELPPTTIENATEALVGLLSPSRDPRPASGCPGTPGAPELVPPYVSRQVVNRSYAASVLRPVQAHDAVLQLGITRPAAEKAPAVALWDLESTFSSGQAEQKQDSSASAVDAVMAMLEKE